MADGRDLASARETPEWAIAVVGSTLAIGTPNGAGPSPADVADAAEQISIAFRASGQDHVVTSRGVWALAWLDDGEVIEFARDVVTGWLEANDLELRWIRDLDR